jgi:hypothetical protein
MLETRATSEGWRPATRVTRMVRPVDQCIREMRLRVRWSESRTLIWSRGEGRPFEKKQKRMILCPREPSLKSSLHSASELPSGSWVEEDFAKTRPVSFFIGRAEACTLLMLVDSFSRRALLSITIPFPGLSCRTYVVARRTCFSCTAVPAPSRAEMYVVALRG